MHRWARRVLLVVRRFPDRALFSLVQLGSPRIWRPAVVLIDAVKDLRRTEPVAIPTKVPDVAGMNRLKHFAIALLAVLMIGLTLFYFVSLLLAKIAIAVLLVIAILVALLNPRPKKNHPGRPL